MGNPSCPNPAIWEQISPSKGTKNKCPRLSECPLDKHLNNKLVLFPYFFPFFFILDDDDYDHDQVMMDMMEMQFC